MSENYLRESLAYGAMVVHLGEFQVFIGEVSQLRNNVVNANIASPQLFQYRA